MNAVLKGRALMCMLLSLVIFAGLVPGPCAFAENAAEAAESPASLSNWDLENVDSFIENAKVYAEYVGGTLYENDFAFVYIPMLPHKGTNFGFLFPGNNYGFAAPIQCIEAACEYYFPRSVYIYPKESGLATLNASA